VVPHFLFFMFITCRGEPNIINKNGSRLFYHLTLVFGVNKAWNHKKGLEPH